jgi:hypothetical protein
VADSQRDRPSLSVTDDKVFTQLSGIHLWQEWFDQSGNPLYTDAEGYFTCFFCGVQFVQSGVDHASDCIFVCAKRLVESWPR